MESFFATLKGEPVEEADDRTRDDHPPPPLGAPERVFG